ncbi:MAG: ATP-binding protein [Myxococcaceae bacterium]
MTSGVMSFAELQAALRAAQARYDALTPQPREDCQAASDHVPSVRPPLEIATAVHDAKNAAIALVGLITCACEDFGQVGFEQGISALQGARAGGERILAALQETLRSLDPAGRVRATRVLVSSEIAQVKQALTGAINALDRRPQGAMSAIEDAIAGVSRFESVIPRLRLADARRAGHVEAIDVSFAARTAVVLLSGCAGSAIELSISAPGDVPHALADLNAFYSVLNNLILNAIDACGGKRELLPGERRALVKVSVTTRGDRVEVTVADTGCGFSPEMTSRIRAGHTTKPQGHGLGVPGSIELLHAMGSELHIHSDGPGEGAVFSFELPMVPEPPPSKGGSEVAI